KFFGTLYNTYSFFALYANIDGFKYAEAPIPVDQRPEIDQWVLSSLQSLVKEVTEDNNQYEATNGGRKIQNFVDEQLSNWYVRLCRRRFWKGDYTEDKIAAYQTLYDCLITISKLMAPISPFFSDWLFRNLNGVTQKEAAISVHLSDFPTADASMIDTALEERMEYAQKISSLVLSLRKGSKIRVRQPLRKILLPVLDDNFQAQVEAVNDLILAEVNIKDIEYITDTSGIIKKKVKPNFKTLGRRLGKHMKAASQMIAGLSQEEIAEIEKTGQYLLQVEGENYELNLDDFEIAAEDIPGWLVANDGPLTVALDVTVTPVLEAEGMARELVNRIQNIRKNKDFNVTDKIKVVLQQHEAVVPAVEQFGDYICNETLAVSLELATDVQGEAITVPEEIELQILVEQV
ncbi:MAG: class I tRNA ligase family protein, partial [Phaeodactylibacter sp.]|nr:class I tRNA ligase family protein [Phaeodactylibacter sp.]